MIVGIGGTTGIVYGLRVLGALRELDIETHLVMTDAGANILAHETGLTVHEIRATADFWYSNGDLGAVIASDPLRTLGMVVAPCSVHDLLAIVACDGNSLLPRAADACLKERRRVVLLFPETPLHGGHLRAMATVTERGAIVFPPVPPLSDRLQSLDEVVNHTVGHVLDLFDLDSGMVRHTSAPGPSRRTDATPIIPADWDATS
jgi:4-hydroxy-3-polyprenylbenzoate decarboxylase